MAHAIAAEKLTKNYGAVRALDGLSLATPEGSVMGLLGPNGAGKTTTVRVLSTLLSFDSGSAKVAGCDVRAEANAVREKIGFCAQHAAVDLELTGFENLELAARMRHLGRRRGRERAHEFLERFGLSEVADRLAGQCSGGTRRRLDLAAALIGDPQVLFLDEPTTGLDPPSRKQLWDAIGALVASGTTVLLTTQYLEEADQLADRIAVIDRGRVIAEGTPAELKDTVGGQRLDVVVVARADVETAVRVLTPLASGPVTVDRRMLRVSAPVIGGAKTLAEAVRRLDEDAVDIRESALRGSTLDDVFIALTGRAAAPRAEEEG